MKILSTTFVFLFFISSLSAGDSQKFKNWNVLKDVLIPMIEGDESVKEFSGSTSLDSAPEFSMAAVGI